jgi:hypothetical protein
MDAPAMIRVSAPSFTAGILIENDRVIRAAPIFNYMLGWPVKRVIALAQRRGWAVEYEPTPAA